MSDPNPLEPNPDEAPAPNPGGDGAPLPFQGSRPPRPVRDTVVMYNPRFFENLGVQSIPIPEFHELASLVADNFGIKIGENKRTLVTGRIHPMMEKYGFANHRECLDAIRGDSSGQLLSELANRISTNHTAFYREEAHFDLLREKVLPEIMRRKDASNDRDLRVWCAACATGEEAYTILFTLLKFFGFNYRNWRAGVLATDISAEALQSARRGEYNSVRLEPVPLDIVNLCFSRIDADTYEVRPEFRREITFRRLNLVNDRYPFKSRFDLIFCRNVMIYFSRNIRLELLARLRDWLVMGGFLFIGHSESLVRGHPGFDYFAPAVYRRSE